MQVRDGDGRTRAAMNASVHAAETSLDVLLKPHLPPLLEAARRVSEDWARWQSRPVVVVHPDNAPGGTDE